MRLSEEQAGAIHSPFDAMLGVRLTEASHDRVTARLVVRPDHHQPGGIVHGGVYATLAETVASIGANLWLGERAAGDAPEATPSPAVQAADSGAQAAASGTGGYAVGVSNHTDFIRATAAGALEAVATPLQRGRTLQLWSVSVTDEGGNLVAHGKVRLANRPPAPAAQAPAGSSSPASRS